jgi:hypothetical protein
MMHIMGGSNRGINHGQLTQTMVCFCLASLSQTYHKGRNVLGYQSEWITPHFAKIKGHNIRKLRVQNAVPR